MNITEEHYVPQYQISHVNKCADSRRGSCQSQVKVWALKNGEQPEEGLVSWVRCST